MNNQLLDVLAIIKNFGLTSNVDCQRPKRSKVMDITKDYNDMVYCHYNIGSSLKILSPEIFLSLVRQVEEACEYRLQTNN